MHGRFHSKVWCYGEEVEILRYEATWEALGHWRCALKGDWGTPISFFPLLLSLHAANGFTLPCTPVATGPMKQSWTETPKVWAQINLLFLEVHCLRCLFQYWGSWLTQVTPCCKMVAFISKANIRLKNALRNDHKLNISSKYYLLPKDLKKFSLFFLKEWVLKNNARKLLEVILCSFKLWPFYPLVFLNTALFYIPELLWSCLSS
jgi:hypothetical protein